MESPDGEYLYYAKDNNDHPRRSGACPVAGGNETPVFPGIRPLDWAAWTLVENGILFVDFRNQRQPNGETFTISQIRSVKTARGTR